jgi:hypothetical protein
MLFILKGLLGYYVNTVKALNNDHLFSTTNQILSFPKLKAMFRNNL